MHKILLFIALAAAAGRSKPFEEAMVRDGDLLFQTSPDSLHRFAARVVASPYNNCGIVHIDRETKGKIKIHVYDVDDQVRFYRIRRWINHGVDRRCVIKRLANGDSLIKAGKNRNILAAEIKRQIGKEQDPLFQWSDGKLYSAELVYKAYRNALGVRLGKTRALKDLDLRDSAVAALFLGKYGKKPPLADTVVTCADLFADPALVEVYNNYADPVAAAPAAPAAAPAVPADSAAANGKVEIITVNERDSAGTAKRSPPKGKAPR